MNITNEQPVRWSVSVFAIQLFIFVCCVFNWFVSLMYTLNYCLFLILMYYWCLLLILRCISYARIWYMVNKDWYLILDDNITFSTFLWLFCQFLTFVRQYKPYKEPLVIRLETICRTQTYFTSKNAPKSLILCRNNVSFPINYPLISERPILCASRIVKS